MTAGRDEPPPPGVLDDDAGLPIGAFDALVAGPAVARGLTLVTHKTR